MDRKVSIIPRILEILEICCCPPMFLYPGNTGNLTLSMFYSPGNIVNWNLHYSQDPGNEGSVRAAPGAVFSRLGLFLENRSWNFLYPRNQWNVISRRASRPGVLRQLILSKRRGLRLVQQRLLQPAESCGWNAWRLSCASTKRRR